MDIIMNYFDSIRWETIIVGGFRVFLVLLGGWVVMKIIHKFLVRLTARLLEQGRIGDEPPSESAKRVETIVRLIRQAAFIALWLTVFLIVLREFGFEVGPILASAGIVGVAIGFGAQNLVRDVISGFFIILENQIRVGDVAIINGTGGLVEKINFRTTVLRDVAGVVHVFPNGTISTLSNLTNDWSAYVFDIGVAYKENTDQVVAVMEKVGAELGRDEIYGPLMLELPEIFGVDKLDNSAVVIKGRIRTKPIRQWQVGREFLRRVKLAFDEHGIEIPFPHQTIYFGEASKPVAVELFDKYKQPEAP
ncbi:MAG: mechanosensitive ion channel family protein [Proteobacteria bacterium]|nr:mechanosensitive ion channel family protein [Pseudomonadota bacterium]MBU1717223.1 mechanosensitive ion channel family protein [Pseudomonadota bacterium]